MQSTQCHVRIDHVRRRIYHSSDNRQKSNLALSHWIWVPKRCAIVCQRFYRRMFSSIDSYVQVESINLQEGHVVSSRNKRQHPSVQTYRALSVFDMIIVVDTFCWQKCWFSSSPTFDYHCRVYSLWFSINVHHELYSLLLPLTTDKIPIEGKTTATATAITITTTATITTRTSRYFFSFKFCFLSQDEHGSADLQHRFGFAFLFFGSFISRSSQV
jgi:hypothetical protein